jgi:hypothetical protein
MVWNAARPADSDRIRLSAGLIRDNWVALETGTTPFDTISLEAQGAYPALAGHNRLYSYLSGVSGKIELCSVNNTGQIVLLTENGVVGSQGQNARFASVYTTNISFDGAFPYTGSLMVTARCSMASNGASSMAVNCTGSFRGTGKYRVTIPAGVLTVNSYQVQVSLAYNGSQDTMIPMIVSKPTINPANPTVIDIDTLYRSDGSYRNTPLDVVIIGGRP